MNFFGTLALNMQVAGHGMAQYSMFTVSSVNRYHSELKHTNWVNLALLIGSVWHEIIDKMPLAIQN